MAEKPVGVESLKHYRPGRELVVLVDGPSVGCWYWRDEFEAQQATARRALERGLPAACGSKAHYQPTEEWVDNPDRDMNGARGRAWRWKP